MDSETIFQNKFQATSERIRFTLVSAFAMVHRAIAQECRMHGISEAVTASIEEKLFGVADGLAGELQGLTAPQMSVQVEPIPPDPINLPDPVNPPEPNPADPPLANSELPPPVPPPPGPSPLDSQPEGPTADGDPAGSVEPPAEPEIDPA